MPSNLVSIIVRTVNRSQLLARALASIQLQTYNNIEVVIINDGGSSLASYLTTNFPQLPYKIIEFSQNKGRSTAANFGIENATGDYVVFLDDDDLLYPNHVEDLINAIGKEAIAYCDALKRLEEVNGDQCQVINKQLLSTEEHSLKRMLEGNFIPINCLIFDRKVFADELFDQQLDVLEDWDLWIRLSIKYAFKHLPKIRAEYSIRTDSSNTTGNNLELWQQTGKLIADRYQELWKAEGLETIPTK